MKMFHGIFLKTMFLSKKVKYLKSLSKTIIGIQYLLLCCMNSKVSHTNFNYSFIHSFICSASNIY